MKTARTAIPFFMVGGFFLLFAVWLFTAPRIRARSHPLEHRGPTILLREEIGGNTYSIHQYDRGAHGDVFLFAYLSDSGIAQMFDFDANGIRVKPDGAVKTFTAVGINDTRLTIPIGLDRILAVLGVMLLMGPFWMRWRSTRKSPKPDEAGA